MRAAVGVRDGVGKAERLLAEALVILEDAIDEDVFVLVVDDHFATARDGDGLGVDLVLVRAHFAHELLHALGVEQHFLTLRFGAFVGEQDADAGIEEGEFAQARLEAFEDKCRRDGEDRGVGEEGDLGAGALRVIEIAEHAERLGGFAALEADGVDLAVAINLALEPVGERVGAFGADAVQAAGEFIRAVAEFAAGVQAGEHEFDGGDFRHLVHLDRNAAAVVLDADGAVGVDGDGDVLAVAGQMLVDGVVDHLEHAVVQAAFIGVADIHAGTEADGFKAFEFLDLIGTIRLVCGDVSGAVEVGNFV